METARLSNEYFRSDFHSPDWHEVIDRHYLDPISPFTENAYKAWQQAITHPESDIWGDSIGEFYLPCLSTPLVNFKIKGVEAEASTSFKFRKIIDDDGSISIQTRTRIEFLRAVGSYNKGAEGNKFEFGETMDYTEFCISSITLDEPNNSNLEFEDSFKTILCYLKQVWNPREFSDNYMPKGLV